jgi:hypothetical protein
VNQLTTPPALAVDFTDFFINQLPPLVEWLVESTPCIILANLLATLIEPVVC